MSWWCASRSLVAGVALGLAWLPGTGCAPQRLVVEVDDDGCTPGCTIVAHEVTLLTEGTGGLCARRAARVGSAGELVLPADELDEGQRYGVSVLSLCAESSCPRCAGEASGEVGQALRVELAAAVSCTSTRAVCAPARRWLPSSVGALSGRMSRDASHAAGALAGPPIFPDLVGSGPPVLKQLDLAPSDDVYIRAGIYEDKPLGNEERLVISTSSLKDYQREGLLRFALGQLEPATTQRATLRLRTAYGSSIPAAQRDARLKLHALSSDSWSEAKVTYKTAPPAGALLDTKPALHLAFTELDATAQIRAEQQGDGVASFRVISDRDHYLAIPSKEDATAAKRPTLRVERAVGLKSSADAASFSFEIDAAGRWYLWARLRYPGTTAPPDGDPNSFWATVDGGVPRVLGNRTDRDGSWHWDGAGGAPLPLGFLTPGKHVLQIVNREAWETSSEQRSPRLDALLLTNDPSYTPRDTDVSF